LLLYQQAKRYFLQSKDFKVGDFNLLVIQNRTHDVQFNNKKLHHRECGFVPLKG